MRIAAGLREAIVDVASFLGSALAAAAAADASDPVNSPRWGDEPGLSRGKLFAKLISLFHRECDVSACHMLSMMWGTGWPALYQHENLLDVTHKRGGDLYGGTSLNYHRHVLAMVKAGSRAKKLAKSTTGCITWVWRDRK